MSEQHAPPTTEESIISAIDEFEKDVEHVPYGSEPSSAEQASIEGREQQPAGDGAADQQGSTQDSAPEPKQEKEGSPPAGAEPGETKPPVKDHVGNLVDRDTGELVAARGAERRVYERANRMQQDNEKLRADLDKHAKTIEELNAQLNAPSRLGLAANEAQIGLQLASQLKTDPIGAARQLLADLSAKGYNVETILGGDGAQVINMGAVTKMIDEKLAPVIGDREERQKQEEARALEQSVQDQLQSFLDTHEHADVHLETLDRFVAETGMPVEKAYYELRLYAVQNNLDFTKPLAPQMSARNTSETAPASNGAATRPQITPGVRSASGAGDPTVVTATAHQGNTSMDADRNMSEIVAEAMLESGMNPRRY